MRIFDFDGVLMDSRDETAVTGYNAVTGRTVTDPADLPAGFLRDYRRERRHARSSAELFLLAFRLWEAPSGDDGTAGVEEAPAPMECAARFFAARSRFMDRDLEAWFALHRPYTAPWTALRENGPAVILTNKNRDATLALCRRFGLDAAAANIYAGDAGGPKADHLNAIHRRFGDPPYEFLEDSLANLLALDRRFDRDRNFFRPLLADWGYLRPGDVEEAGAMGIPVLDQDTAVRWIRGERGPVP